MSGAYACSTVFFNCNPAELAEQYEAVADPANGYLTRLDGECVLVDAQATEMADWSRQIDLATLLCTEEGIAISVFVVGELWALAVARDGQPGPVASFTPDNAKTMQQLPHALLAIERLLADLFPERVDADDIDQLFGAIIEGATTPDEGMAELLELLGCSPDWLRWSWYETIPEQLFLDPDLSYRVIPLGAARELWEE